VDRIAFKVEVEVEAGVGTGVGLAASFTLDKRCATSLMLSDATSKLDASAVVVRGM
jgi:hypothetical protein